MRGRQNNGLLKTKQRNELSYLERKLYMHIVREYKTLPTFYKSAGHPGHQITHIKFSDTMFTYLMLQDMPYQQITSLIKTDFNNRLKPE